jgi:replicative DNA helicase
MSETLDTLQRYGTSFQSKVISALLTDKKIMESIGDIIKSDFFESDANKWIVNTIIQYYGEYRRIPTLDVFKVELYKNDNATLKTVVREQLRHVFTEIGTVDLEFIKKEFSDFCRNQNLKEVILQSVDLLKAGNYNKIKELVDTAMKVGTSADIGHDYIKDVLLRMDEDARDTVPTGFEPIDDLMDGGLGAGELGVVVANSGIGKSWVLAQIGAHAMKMGKRVVHYTLELSETYVGRRYDTILSGIPTHEIRERKDEVQDKLKSIKGNVIIKYLPPKSVTAKRLESHIDKLIQMDMKPDLIIIDYADLMRSHYVSSDSTYQEAAGIYIELRAMSGEYGIPTWTASQANRSGISTDVLEADSVADSYGKVMNADFVVSLMRKPNDKLNNTAKFYVMKNRFGPDGLSFPAKMDTNIGMIKVFEQTSADGMMAMKDSKDGEKIEKQLLFNKYSQLTGGKKQVSGFGE